MSLPRRARNDRLRRVVASCFLRVALLVAGPLHAQEAADWLSEPAPLATIRLAAPAANEVVIVVNNNSAGGNHAGMFAGAHLIDPAGSYFGVRSRDKDWTGPSLPDYVRYQMVDGNNIRVYRFAMDRPEFEAIQTRMADAGITPPLFCAATVQNIIAGVGPFKELGTVWWTSPSALADALNPVSHGPGTAGVCVMPDESPC